MTTRVMGFDLSNVPTADVMEFAAKLLKLDADTIDEMRRLVPGARSLTQARDTNLPIAELLLERAKALRALEAAPRRAELDS